jgi:hypothetical protein
MARISLMEKKRDDFHYLLGAELIPKTILSRNNAIQPQMNTDERRWEQTKTLKGTSKLSHPTVGAVRAGEMPSNDFLSASICVYLRFQLHGSGLEPPNLTGLPYCRLVT